MLEKFTDRARKVMQLANQEAQRFSHDYVGTEHILIGLVKEGSGVASNVLKNLHIDLHKVRLEVEKLVQPGPDYVSMGKLPHTPRAKKVIEYAMEEVNNLKHNYLGTEHVLLGLLREDGGIAAQVLRNLGLQLPEVRSEVLNLLGYKKEEEDSEINYISNKTWIPSKKADIPSAIKLPAIDLSEIKILAPNIPEIKFPYSNISAEVKITTSSNLDQIKGGSLDPLTPTTKQHDPAMRNVMLQELKRLLIQQADTTTAMLKLLKDL